VERRPYRIWPAKSQCLMSPIVSMSRCLNVSASLRSPVSGLPHHPFHARRARGAAGDAGTGARTWECCQCGNVANGQCCQLPMGRVRASAPLLFPPPRWRLPMRRSRGSATLPAREVPVGKRRQVRWRSPRGGNAQDARCPSCAAKMAAPHAAVARERDPPGGNTGATSCREHDRVRMS